MQTKALSRLCPDCGALVEVQEYRGMLEFLNQVTALCDACAEKRSQRQSREELQAECRARYFNLLNRGLVTERFRSVSFSRSKRDVEALNPGGWQQGRDWALSDNLYIHGHIGTGKTFLALCCLRKAFVAGLDVAETTARQFAKTTDLFRDPSGLFEAWKRVDVLLLDDFDKVSWNLDRIDALWELLNARMASERRTILTGNASLRDIAVGMRERTGDGQKDTRNTSRADAALERLKPITQIELVGRSLRL